MRILAFLPESTAEYVATAFEKSSVLLASSWNDFLRQQALNRELLLIVDPTHDGGNYVRALTDLLTMDPSIPVIAYVALSAANLRAVFELSRIGVTDALVHGHSGNVSTLRKIATRAATNASTWRLFRMIESGLGTFEPRLIHTVRDVFQRPERYSSAKDLSLESSVPLKELYKAFDKSRLGTPRKLLVSAKMIRGYSYLREIDRSVSRASALLGYRDRRDFSDQVAEVFGCPASRLRDEPNSEEVLLRLIEWLYKPTPTGKNCVGKQEMADATRVRQRPLDPRLMVRRSSTLRRRTR